jgi:thioredoxin-related protein
VQRFSGYLESAANVAIICLAIVVGVLFYQHYSLSSQAAKQQIKVGQELTVAGERFTGAHKTVVLAISTQCHYCTESAPFYRRLVQEIARKKVAVVAVLPQGTSDAKQYLSSENVAIDKVLQASPQSIGVQGTPTLILVDSIGKVSKVWVGKLRPEQENEVLSQL